VTATWDLTDLAERRNPQANKRDTNPRREPDVLGLLQVLADRRHGWRSSGRHRLVETCATVRAERDDRHSPEAQALLLEELFVLLREVSTAATAAYPSQLQSNEAQHAEGSCEYCAVPNDLRRRARQNVAEEDRRRKWKHANSEHKYHARSHHLVPHPVAHSYRHVAQCRVLPPIPPQNEQDQEAHERHDPLSGQRYEARPKIHSRNEGSQVEQQAYGSDREQRVLSSPS
jgi:hypothetical protein